LNGLVAVFASGIIPIPAAVSSGQAKFFPPAVTGRIPAGFAAAGALKGAENGRIAENLPVEVGITALFFAQTTLFTGANKPGTSPGYAVSWLGTRAVLSPRR